MQAPLRPIARSSYICTSCLSKRSRQLSGTGRLHTASAPPPPSPPPSGFTHLTHRGLVLLSGHDAPKFLNGLTTNLVEPSRTTPWYSGFLNAQGRVLWDTLIYPHGRDGNGDLQYLIEVDAGEVSSFIKHLKRHKLRSKISTRDVQDEWSVWAAWQSSSESPISSPADGEDIIHTPDPRLPSLGARILLGRGSPANMRSYEALSETSLDEYTIRRYLHGIPEGQKEILRETALPMESNMDYLNGIDFRKGCYVGQELTIRTQHTGVIRKRILPVQLYDSDSAMPDELSYSPDKHFAIESGTDIKAEGAKRPAGRFLASVENVGLALCRLENMTDLRVSAEGGTFKEGMEFSVTSTAAESGQVKVKAFVPQWLRVQEQEKVERRASRQQDPAVE